MRKFLCSVLIVASCVISGCIVFDSLPKSPEQQTGEEMNTQVELEGAHYAKLNSIGCLHVGDMEIAKKADFDTISNLIKENRCFVIPTNTDIYIKERVSTDIVSVKLKESKQLFYTVKSNLVAK